MDKAAFIVVFTTVPDKISGERIAQALVESRVAACASLCLPCESTYWWQGAVSRETEHTLIIKTTARLYPAVEQKIRELHPYEVPEIIALPILRGSQPYLDWIASETRSD